MTLKEIFVPDLGGAERVDVIELNVTPGDYVVLDQGIVTLESDKATMEVPATFAGIIKEFHVKVGDKLSEGQKVATIDTVEAGNAHSMESTVSSNIMDIIVPDLGGAEQVEVIEINVKPGDIVGLDQGLITLESDKATMEVPSPFSGTIKEILVKIGDTLSEGQKVATIESVLSGSLTTTPATNIEVNSTHTVIENKAANIIVNPFRGDDNTLRQLTQTAQASAIDSRFHATPMVRRLASEFGIDLSRVTATGPKGRLLKQDIQIYVKQQLVIAHSSSTASFSLPQMPIIDFSKFGDTDIQVLSKIKKLTGTNLSRNWIVIPHVTQFDQADITDLEKLRKESQAQAESRGVKLTPLVFIMRAVVLALKEFPRFNASLSADNQTLILKKYFNLGVAVDTPEGLVVPVIRDVDQKDSYTLAQELAEVSEKARQGKLLPKDMQGGCFTISSLGGIGGTAFTPIVNAPEVAILGVSKSQMKPVYQDQNFVPRLMLPLSLSYDHRVIDGAEGARFVCYLCKTLSDIKKIVL